ncbi:hypothetical protein CEXT_220611 [Caerostris extrusa]|uniref:Uncharacterized protein n=1 Tax=Caerostris extrusa TaxID=172846 RepID=A0AAV4N014_CAEEX|nr:hypothetical protein CEXT_220611 [Caerostris extrusa]
MTIFEPKISKFRSFCQSISLHIFVSTNKINKSTLSKEPISEEMNQSVRLTTAASQCRVILVVRHILHFREQNWGMNRLRFG